MQTQDRQMSYYEWIAANDIIGHLKPLLEGGGFNLRLMDGKFHRESAVGFNTPWHHVKHAWNKDCATWHQIIFNVISSKLPERAQFVPSECQHCWKVVVRPDTLKGLFALLSIQEKLQFPSKCGIEVRPTVCGLYGGYFYNESLQGGLYCYSVVRKEVDDNEILGPGTRVMLKRGCTEMEALCGDSRRWQVSEYQLALEQLVDRYIVKDDYIYSQPDHVIWNVHRKWIEFAYQNGDKTYLEFTGGKPLHEPYVTYHHLLGKEQGEIDDYFNAEEKITS